MSDKNADQESDVDMSNVDMVFDNLTILKEFSNIVNSVSTEDFLETVPKAKLTTSKRIKWVPTFNCLKQGLLNEITQEMNEMWKNENMPLKLEILEKQKEKFSEMNTENTWRPQLGDVKAQLKASDMANLQKQKLLLECLAKQYENRVDRLKKTLPAKREYLKALQMDIQQYQKKNDDFITHNINRINNYNDLPNIMSLETDVETSSWDVVI